MNQKLLTKVLASLLVMTLTFANFIMLGVYASKTYATSDDLEKQVTVTNNENVTFDAYFKGEKGNAIHTIRENMSKQDLKLYVSIQVKKGYLKNAKVQVLGENGTSSNLKLKNSNEALEYVEGIDEVTNTISLKQVNTGTQIVLELPVEAAKEDLYDLANFSKLNDMVLTGTYVGDSGKETKIEKTIQTRNEWTQSANPVLEQQLVRFIPYEVKEEKGTILQTLVRSGIENNVLPIEETKITLTVPQVNGKNPASVNVIPNGTLETNGQAKENFLNDNWSYDTKTGSLVITVKNDAQENKVSWLKDIKDEFIVTYIYDEKVDTVSAVQTASSEVKVYNSVETKLTKNNELEISTNEVLGQIVTGKVETTEALSKGYLYTKSERETKYEEKVTLDVAYPELVDALTIKQDMDYFVNEAGEISPLTIGDINYAYYKTTKISKVNFEKILGVDGSVKISTISGEEIATFNKDTVADENGDYVFNYEDEVNQIVITTTKPVLTGKLEIEHEKMLKGKTDYSKAQVESFKTLKVMANVQAVAESTVISTVDALKEITLVAPSTKIETSVSNANLSTVITNENVELRVILKSNDITCDLYKNPTVEIVLPNYISNLNIKDVNLLFDNELKIKDYNTYVNENGNIVIKVNIEGEQTLYSGDEISKGANLIINTDITLKQLTPTKDDVMKVYVTNELVTTYEQIENTRARSVKQKGYSETSLKAVAPVGMVTTNTISGYNANNETVTSMSSQEQTGKLDVKKEARTATVSMNVINNYQNVVNNMVVLGRIPTAGSVNADTLEDFGSNLASQIASTINISGVDAASVEVYYSTNAKATKDLSLETNAWTKTLENMANVKSYLVVINGDIATGTTLGFSYSLAIPENLSYNMGAYSNYVVYFNNVKTEGTTSEKAVATKVGISSGEGPELEVSISSDMEGKDVEEGKIITYTVTVKNVGKSEVKNVTVSGNIPEKTVYTYFTGKEITEGSVSQDAQITQMYNSTIKNYTENIESIKVGETKTITYKVETTTLNSEIEKLESDVLEAQAIATVKSYDTVFESSKATSNLIEGYVKLSIDLATIPAIYAREEGQKVKYIIDLQNLNYKEKNDTVLYFDLPEGLKFETATNDGKYDEANDRVVWNIGKLTALTQKTLAVEFTVNKLDENSYEKDITAYAIIKTSEKEVKSNEITFKVKKANLTISQTSETKNEVEIGDSIIYNIIVKNEGSTTAREIKVTDYIPEGLRYVSAQYSVDNITYESSIGNENGIITLTGLKAGATMNIKIEAIAEELEEGTQKREVTNIVKVVAKGIEESTANEITHTIVAKQNITDDPSLEDNTQQEGTHSISGVAWLDSDGDGQRDDDEQRMASIPVILINADNGQIVKDITTGKDKIQETGENGEYIFANLKPGKYMVVFLYESGNYGVTIYKQAGVNDDKNSDAVQMNVVYEGISRIAGVSDKLRLANENIRNIDLGLITSPKFDLKLDKVISKITVSDSKGTNVHEYKDEKLAKLDLNSKTANESTIMIEYRLRVTNEGGIAGYAKKIVDYIPSDMKFSSELNKDWYTSDNGTNLYNTSLANTLIQPGETKEITLLLTKKITDSNMGIINNTAEIAESYNDLGLEDIDSKVANKVQTEDDYSSADAIIGTKTGEVYMYILLTISTISILGVGIYLIKKKVLNRV